MLACFRYFLGYPRPCLTRTREVKVAEGDLAMCSIGGIFAGDISVWGVSVEAVSVGVASAGDTYVGAGLSSIGS